MLRVVSTRTDWSPERTPGCLKILLLAAFLCSLDGRACLADTYTLTESQGLYFGELQQPSSGSQTFSVSTTGSTSGTGTFLYGVSPAAGRYTLKCTSGTCGTVTIDVPSFSGACGVTYGSFIINYNNGEYVGPVPHSGLSNPGTTGETLLIGGTATYPSTVPINGACGNAPSITVNGNPLSYSTNILFDYALTLVKSYDFNFGTVAAGVAGTYTIQPHGTTVTAAGGGQWLSGTAHWGQVLAGGSNTEHLNISVGGYTANNGVSIQNVTCDWYGVIYNPCIISNALPVQGSGRLGFGHNLDFGATVSVDGTQGAGTTAAPSFTVTVTYQ